VSAARAGSTDAGRRCAVPASVRGQVSELVLGLAHPGPSVYSFVDPDPQIRTSDKRIINEVKSFHILKICLIIKMKFFARKFL
jgi:hypothetical protein